MILPNVLKRIEVDAYGFHLDHSLRDDIAGVLHGLCRNKDYLGRKQLFLSFSAYEVV